MPKPLRNGPQLPRELLDRIGQADSGLGSGPRHKRLPSVRKERRTAARVEKRTQRVHSQKKWASGAYGTSEKLLTKLSPQEDDDYSDEDIDTSHTAITMRDKRPVVHAQDNFKPSDNIANSEQLTSDEESLEARPKQPGISRAVATRLAEDDADIKALERKLGMKGSGKNSNPLDGNGLDDLLGTLGSPASEDDKIKKRRRDEGDDWLREKRKKARLRSDTNTRHDIFPNVERKNFEHCSTPRDALQGDMSEECEDDEFSGFDVYETASLVSASKLRENPYLPPRTSLGNTASKYVPPSLRMQDSSNQESLTKLKRQIQGTLNRLAEANMLGIVRDIQGLYRQNPRQHVSSLLLDCLFGLICDVSPLSDTFMILHGGFVAALHRTLGMEFAAQAVQRVAENFEGFTPRQARGGETGKQLSNLITFLAELYNFQVVGSGLIYDYIRIFVADLSEEHTELLLKIARLSGPQLRQDDPSSLKDTVALIQSAVAKTGFDALSVRSKFMIETIENLKNNRMKTGFAASSVTSEHTVRMKKVLASISQGSARSSEPLRITLRDIQNSNKKGRWWLIGASYRDGGANAPNNIATKSSIQGTSAEDEQDLDAATDLLQLAREQRMNTDVRRSIFVSILSSTDYRDATQRLLKLRLKKAQELEIPKVILRCAGAEKSYNPFYTLISRELCKDHRIRMAFQFCLWDEFKGMEEDEKELEDDFGDRLDMRALVNLARMFGTLVADSKLGISLFKNLNLTYLQPKIKSFVEVFLVTLFVDTYSKDTKEVSKQRIESIFTVCKEMPAMASGLRVFLKKTVKQSDLVRSSGEKRAVREGCKGAEKVLANLFTSSKIDNAAAIDC